MAININVNATNVTINEPPVLNQGEYNINTCVFTFIPEYEGLSQRAIFSNVLGQKFLVEIRNNQCVIPEEILRVAGRIVVGVFAYELTEDNELVLRYSPTPATLIINEGSYVSDAETVIPPEVLKDLYQEVEDAIKDLNQKAEDGYFDGYTPVKGVDYFTEADINEFTTTITNNVNREIGLRLDAINGEVV